MAGSERPIRLLLVDDELEFIDAMTPGLERRGFAVTSATNGQAALEVLSSAAFDVVVLDVKMPVLDGVDTFREIKRFAPRLPVIILTGHGSLEQAFETSREGVYDYLTKPCNVDDLARLATEAVAQAHETSEPVELPLEGIGLLVVDDDRDFVDSISPALERRGVHVTKTHDGPSAIRAASTRQHEVALVDVMMPGMDGLALLDELRRVDPLLEVIILTGYPRVPDARRGFKQGAFDFLVKPQRVEDLLASIRAAYERRETRRKSERDRKVDEILERHPD